MCTTIADGLDGAVHVSAVPVQGPKVSVPDADVVDVRESAVCAPETQMDGAVAGEANHGVPASDSDQAPLDKTLMARLAGAA